MTVALFMPNLATFVLAFALATACLNAGFMLIGPIVASVVPYRLRSQGYAMVGVYVFLSGAILTIDGARDNWLGAWPPRGLVDEAGKPLTEERKQ